VITAFDSLTLRPVSVSDELYNSEKSHEILTIAPEDVIRVSSRCDTNRAMYWKRET
jgi:hypothetical protein